MASCQFVEELLIQRIILLPVPRGHEDVASDVLVHDLTICRHTAEGHVHVTVELDGDLESEAESKSYLKSLLQTRPIFGSGDFIQSDRVRG